jgi:ABC-2 type transport system ATP-binding protein
MTSMATTADGGVRATPVVACQGLTKVFKDFWMRDRARAVDHITFEVRPHEVFGLLGPNGSGKSTTIKVLLGLLRATSGRVAVFGKPPTDVAVKRRIGYLPEESYLYPFLNARETLDYYGKLFELDHRTRGRRVDELLEMVGLGGAQFRTVREYSKGMQRRLGIAQALINDPDFLILDEPTTGLDPIGTRQIKDLIINLGRRGKTVLLSSHLLADVEDCVDRMVILYGGKVRAEGTCGDLLETADKTAIEADSLDDGTIEEVDRIIRARSGGAKSILKVSRPRQKLEELFLDIVERARAERAETSGAMHGGETASFLKGGETGDQLIERLVHTPEPEAAEPVQVEAAAPEEDLIGNLTRDRPEEAPAAKRPEPVKPVDTSEVDRSVIDSLLSDRGDGTEPKG